MTLLRIMHRTLQTVIFYPNLIMEADISTTLSTKKKYMTAKTIWKKSWNYSPIPLSIIGSASLIPLRCVSQRRGKRKAQSCSIISSSKYLLHFRARIKQTVLRGALKISPVGFRNPQAVMIFWLVSCPMGRRSLATICHLQRTLAKFNP